MADGKGKVKAIEFDAEVRQVKSMADGSVNVTLNLPEYCMPQAKVLLDWLRDQVRCVMEIIVVERTETAEKRSNTAIF